MIVNHALYFADVAHSVAHGRRRDPPRARRRRLRRGAPARGGGRELVRRDGSRWGAFAYSRATPSEPAASRMPRLRFEPSADIDRLGVLVLGELEPASGRARLTAGALAPVLDAALVLAAALGELAQGLRGVSDEADAVGRRALVVADDLEACLTLDDPDRVSWAEPGAVGWAPVDVSQILRDELWERPVTAILVSATLEPGARPSPAWGSRTLASCCWSHPTTTEPRRCSTHHATFPSRARPALTTASLTRSTALCRLSRGRALVLTTSYRALDAFVERVAPELPYPVLCQGDAPRERLLEQFREQVESVLFATATFWQGVDVSGESLSLVVIDKLPFSAPGDPLVEARCERIAREGGDWFADYALPSAVLQLRQGFGRLDQEPRRSGCRRRARPPDPHTRLRAAVSRGAAAVPSRVGSLRRFGFLRRGAPCDRLMREGGC